MDVEDSEEPVPTVDCQYYSMDEFALSKFNPKKNFSILHYNIHSIQLHIEEFCMALQLLDFTFDVICISESKIRKDIEPIVDISLPGYQTSMSMPTEATKGGVLMYIRTGLNFKPRNDLQIYKPKLLESIFIEIINERDTNDIVGVIYRHPSMSESDFIDNELKSITEKLSNDNKKVFIAGDFNFDLLNTANHDETYEFFDTRMSNFLLPVITLPTKINRGENTLIIDSIFTNQLNPETISGNLELDLSDGHLPSFLIIPKNNQNHLPKKHNIFSRSAKNFNSEAFIQDYRNIDWDNIVGITKNDVNHSMDNFFVKIQ